MKRCLIVDDEISARQLIKEYLSDFDEFVEAGEAVDGISAVKMINELQPDVVFLDVQMPGLNGLEVLEEIDFYPTIIFSTAFDSYAINAFEVHAVDYLLKPYTKARFEKAISRINSPETKDKQMELIEKQIFQSKEFPTRILVERQQEFFNISIDDVIKIEAYGDYSKVFTSDKYYLSKNGLSKLEEKLSPKQFMRIHRSTIINQQSLLSLSKLGKGYIAKLKDGDEVKVSRSYAKKVKDMIL